MIRVRRISASTYALADTHFNETLRDVCRRVPGMRWDGAERAWLGYPDAIAVAAKLLQAEAESGTYPATIQNPKDIPTPPSAKTPNGLLVASKGLRDYQNEDIAILIQTVTSGAICAWEMSLGKSLAALTVARAFKGTTLILCPSHARSVWGDDKDTSEVYKWWREAFPPLMLEGVRGGSWYVKLRGNEELLTRTHQGVWLQAEKDINLGASPGQCAKCRKLTPEMCKKHAKMLDDLPWRATRWTPQADFAFPSLKEAEACVATLWPNETRSNIAKLVEFIPGTLFDPDSANAPKVVVCHYDILYAWAPHLAGIVRTFIADEAHKLTNAKARWTQAAKSIARLADQKLALTGTPMTNYPKNLWALVDVLSEGRFGENPFNGIDWGNGYYARYCGAAKEQVPDPKNGPKATQNVWKYDGRSNEDELHERLRFFMVQRTKEGVHFELPPLTRQVVNLKVQKRYSISPQTAIVNGKLSDKLIRKALDLAADGKLPEIVEMVADAVEQGNKVVVFCYRHVVSEHLTTELVSRGIDANFIHGGVPYPKRIDRIKSQPAVLCAGIDVSSTAINLSYASMAFFAELTYKPHDLLQAEARLHRSGQRNPVFVRYCIGEGTADQLIAQSVIRKLDTFEKVVGKVGGGLKEDLRGGKPNETEEEREEAALAELYKALLKQSKEETT